MIADFYYYHFVALGLVVSYEDWSQRRVRNRWIVLGMLTGAAGLAYLFWNSVLGHQGVRREQRALGLGALAHGAELPEGEALAQ